MYGGGGGGVWWEGLQTVTDLSCWAAGTGNFIMGSYHSHILDYFISLSNFECKGLVVHIKAKISQCRLVFNCEKY